MLLPLKVDVPMWRRPLANYILLIVIAGVSLLGFVTRDTFEALSGSVSFLGQVSMAEKRLPLALLAITSAFLHGGFIHMIGNLWFLWVFGNAVNYKFGQWQYLCLFLTCAWFGGMCHYLLDGRPMVGASGAINGIVAAYLVFFPRNDVLMAWVWGIWGRTFSLSGYWVILFWFAWDVGSLVLGLSPGVALWAHIGGFAAGFSIAFLCAHQSWIKPTQDEETLLQLLWPEGKQKSRYY